jgi:hypothetical protein
MEAKARELHKHDSLLAGRESPCRDSTIEGNVGVWGEAYAPLMDRDNGDAGAEGQPPLEAFPKGFVEGFVRGFIKAFVGLTGGANPVKKSAFQQ